MDTQYAELYEVIVPETDESFITEDRNTALYHYRKGDMVFETHKTISNTTPFTQARVYLTLQWHNNPNFNPDSGEED